FFFFNDTATTEIYTLSLHDALPISISSARSTCSTARSSRWTASASGCAPPRSEEHTSELQSQFHLVCRLLREEDLREMKRVSRDSRRHVRICPHCTCRSR